MYPGEDCGDTIADYNNWLKLQPNYDPEYLSKYDNKWRNVKFLLELAEPIENCHIEDENILDKII